MWSRWERYMFREVDLHLSSSSLHWYPSLSYCLSVSLSVSLFLSLCVCVYVHVFACVQVSLDVCTCGGQRKMEDFRHPALSLNPLVQASHLTQRPQCPVILLSPSPTSLDL